MRNLKILLATLMLNISFFGFCQYSFIPSTVPFKGVVGGDIQVGDLNDDNLPDILICGTDNSFQPVTLLYLNQGGGMFSPSPVQPFDAYSDGSIMLLDIDGDGDLDVSFYGSDVNEGAVLYMNNSSGGTVNFTQSSGFSSLSDQVFSASTAYADMDNDGIIDIVYTGFSYLEGGTFIYFKKGLGGGIFDSEQKLKYLSNDLLDGVQGTLILADMDNDGDIDIFVTGETGMNYTPLTKIYSNILEEQGVFSFDETVVLPFSGLVSTEAAILDVDNDGDFDILISGEDGANMPQTTLYYNHGGFNFTTTKSNDLENVMGGVMAYADIDGDGDIDIIVSGYTKDNNNNDTIVTVLHINDGTGYYSKITGPNVLFNGAGDGNLSMADIDGDGDIDIIVSGFDVFGSTDALTTLYLNHTPQVSSVTSYDGSVWVIYPNPSDGIFTIHTAENMDNTPIEIYSTIGELLYSTHVLGSTAEINLENFPSGVYLVKLNNHETTRIIKY
ncbi:MAG: T9SS type A sorting domain-containing protein [Brumimicrobium sp.]|nr:T9SS type A sorting domain-containing protein [Brumimicrobium sp.]